MEYKKLLKNLNNLYLLLKLLNYFTDYVQFKKEAAEKNAKGSATDAMLTSLASYSEALKNISSQYKKAQIKAINRANYLCK